MSDGEEHSNDLELGCGGDMVHDKEPGKIRGGGKRMEEKTEKPKRQYKKRTPKERPTTEREGGVISKTPNRNRVAKRNPGASKKRTRHPATSAALTRMSPVVEAELLDPTGGPSRFLQLDPRKFIPLNEFLANGQSPDGSRREWECCAYGHSDDEDDDAMSSDSDSEECTLTQISELLGDILVELRKHKPKKQQ